MRLSDFRSLSVEISAGCGSRTIQREEETISTRATTPTPWADWNGQVMPLADVRVSVCDRSFLFGDGIYEVLRVYHGRPFLINEHFDRLAQSLAEIQLVIDHGVLRERAERLLKQSGFLSAILYLQVTRGAPVTGPSWRTHHFPPLGTLPNALVSIHAVADDPYAEQRSRGVRVILQPDIRWKHCHIKSVNLLPNCLAAEAAARADCYEALLFDEQGLITEGSHTSVFGVRGGRILTTPLSPQVLPGITRGLIVKLATTAGITIDETPLRVADLDATSAHALEELFLTGTTAEVMPVTHLRTVEGGKSVDHLIGKGTPGPIARRLQTAYRQAIS